ncbi:MAG: hypothetical protein NT154_05290 [Verrucomicrobia bacterium]|nr:hypothetical protein [Verrucomicrobiota bacterium]
MSPQAGELLCTEIVPRIRSLAPGFTPIGADDREEQAQDAIAMAAELLISADRRGKKPSASNLSYYALKLVKQGRRSTGQSTTDAMSPGTQIAGRSSLVSLEQPLNGAWESEEPTCLHDMLAARTEDPSLAASRRLDWAPLVTALDGPIAEVLRCLIEGEDLTTLVPKLKRSRSALQFDKQRLAHLVREHLGEDVLARVQDQPRWRDNIDASRERAACRYERQAA